MEFKETSYHVKLSVGDCQSVPLVPRYWKTRGSRWMPFMFAPDALREYYIENWKKATTQNVRPCRGEEKDYLCGEVTIQTALSRMGAYLRKRRGLKDS
jgi:hypothetical protein